MNYLHRIHLPGHHLHLVADPAELDHPARAHLAGIEAALADRLRDVDAHQQRLAQAPMMHSYARLLRWAYATPPWLRLAEQRVGLRKGSVPIAPAPRSAVSAHGGLTPS